MEIEEFKKDVTAAMISLCQRIERLEVKLKEVSSRLIKDNDFLIKNVSENTVIHKQNDGTFLTKKCNF